MQNDNSWNPSACICENSKYLKSIPDTSVTECDEIIIVMDNVATKKTNTIATNVRSTASINCHSMKVRDCYILHTVLLAIIFLLIRHNIWPFQESRAIACTHAYSCAKAFRRVINRTHK